MNILLTKAVDQREARSPTPLLDMASYGRSFGHAMHVGYVEHIDDLSAFDEVWVSSTLMFTQDQLEFIQSVRARYGGRLVFGGKVTDTMSDGDINALRCLDITVHKGHGEVLLSGGEPDMATYPAWSEADFRALDITNSMTEMMTSRGCPYHCHFCHNTEPRVSYFSHERSALHAELILTTLQRPRIFIVDDIFALRSDHMLGFLAACDSLGVNIRKRNSFFVHASHLDEERLSAIDALQPQEMQIGIESGDDGMLSLMGKTFTAEQAEAGLRALHGRGHLVACLFLMGFPGETKESLTATVEFVRRNRQYMSGWWVSFFQAVPNTRGWEMACERLGQEVRGAWNTDITYLDPALTRDDLIEARLAVMTP